MKAIPLIIFFLLFNQLLAQNTSMEIHLNNGTLVTFSIDEIEKITFEGLTDLKDFEKFEKVIKTFRLFQNYPNPFNPATTISYELPKTGKVQLQIFDLTGKKVCTLFEGKQLAGKHEIQWNGHNNAGRLVASGFYIYQIRFGGKQYTKKMIFLK